MKFLKNSLAIVALLAIGSVDARAVRGTGTTRPSGQPVSRQVSKVVEEGQERPKEQKEEPRKLAKTFKQLAEGIMQLAEGIMNARPVSVWNSKTNLLQDNFVKQVVADCKYSDLSSADLDMLLKLARDKHAQFTGISKTDTARLDDLATQRFDAQELLKKDEPLTTEAL